MFVIKILCFNTYYNTKCARRYSFFSTPTIFRLHFFCFSKIIS